MSQDVLRVALEKGVPYEEYVQQLIQRVEAQKDARFSDARQKTLYEYSRLNAQRFRRIGQSYRVPGKMCELVRALPGRQVWLLITEDWCGDTAQTMPYVAKWLSCNKNIDLRVLLRDEHPEIMDRYLTDGKRSIPVLVAFDEQGHELFRWGPRPAEAAAVLKAGLEAGLERKQAVQNMHLWYSRNRGKAVEQEFAEIFARLLGETDKPDHTAGSAAEAGS